MIERNTHIWYKTGDLSKGEGKVISYIGEGNYEVWNDEIKAIHIVNLIDIIKLMS